MSVAPSTAALGTAGAEQRLRAVRVPSGAPAAAHAAARATTLLSMLALASPAAGLAFEVSLAWRFGTSPTVDAFRVAALLLTFGQQLFVSQILPHTVVPLLTEYRAAGNEAEGWHVALSLANLLSFPALLFSLAAFLWPGRIVQLLAPGLAGEGRAATEMFLRWFLLAYAPMVWGGVAAGIFYARKIFWLPPAVQLANNLILVAGILALSRTLGAASLVCSMLLSTVFGLGLYLSRLIPLMRRENVRFPWRPDPTHPGVRRALLLALPLLGMVLVMQVGSVALNRALSRLPSGSLAEFGYVWKMGWLTLLVPLSLSTVLFPRFAEARFGSGGNEFREICTRALRMALFLSIPLAWWFAVLRTPLVTVLFLHGAFSAEAAATAARLFGLMLLAAPGFAAYATMEKMLYALGKTHVPMLAQMASAALLTAFCGAAAQRAGIAGLIGLAGPVATWVVAFMLFEVLRRRSQAFRWAEILPSTLRLIALAAASAGIARQTSVLIAAVGLPEPFSAAVEIAGGLLAGGSLFAVACLILQIPEALACAKYMHWAGNAVAKKFHLTVPA